MSDRKNVVIIGGSFAGVGVAGALLKKQANKVKVTIINPSETHYFNIAAPRILAKPKAFQPDQYLHSIKKAFANYPKGSFEFVQGAVAAIDPATKAVTLTNGASVSFDYLVIASGSSTSSTLAQGSAFAPFKPTDDLRNSIAAAQQQIQDAQNVVIGGAGPVGIEFAGELAEAFEGKSGSKITLISASPRVLNVLSEKASATAEKILTQKGVNVIKSRKVVDAVQDPNTLKWSISLDNGESLQADVYISTTGVIPNNSFIPQQYLNRDGWVDVDAEMHVKGAGSDPIYAIGDITQYPLRVFMRIGEQIPVLVGNLEADITGSTKRSTYTDNPKIMMLVPVGAKTGTGAMFGWTPWGKMVSMIKGKDFFVSKSASLSFGS